MKKLVLTLILLFAFFCSRAQFTQYCGTPRYDTEVFSTIDVTSNVLYGSNNVAGGGPTNLMMDIYEPSGDTASIRPLIVWVHGGSFVAGTKNDADIVSLCNHFAKRGYVCASINYRLGFAAFPPNGPEAKRAVYRAVQDMKAAVRFFRKDADSANIYKIDPQLIFGGGSSAGAFTALHLAYLDEPSEIPSDVDTTLLGGLEGNSGNPGYSSEINAVINLCGALGDKYYMKPGDEPLVSMHGTNDQTVPYATDIIIFLGVVPIMPVDGSYSIAVHADSIGLTNEMYTWYGQDHVPYLSSTAYMDTTVRFVSNFLYKYMGCTPVDPFPLANTFPTGISTISQNSFLIYPNPSDGNIRFNNTDFERFVVSDISGKIVYASDVSSESVFLSLENGMYFYKCTGNTDYSGRLIIANRDY